MQVEPEVLKPQVEAQKPETHPHAKNLLRGSLRQDWWTAKVYDRFVGRTLHEINSMAGGLPSGLGLRFINLLG